MLWGPPRGVVDRPSPVQGEDFLRRAGVRRRSGHGAPPTAPGFAKNTEVPWDQALLGPGCLSLGVGDRSWRGWRRRGAVAEFEERGFSGWHVVTVTLLSKALFPGPPPLQVPTGLWFAFDLAAGLSVPGVQGTAVMGSRVTFSSA